MCLCVVTSIKTERYKIHKSCNETISLLAIYFTEIDATVSRFKPNIYDSTALRQRTENKANTNQEGSGGRNYVAATPWSTEPPNRISCVS